MWKLGTRKYGLSEEDRKYLILLATQVAAAWLLHNSYLYYTPILVSSLSRVWSGFLKKKMYNDTSFFFCF